MHPAFAPADRALQALDGVVGVAVRTVAGEVLYAVREGEAFPAASVIKVPLVLAVLADAAAGRLSLEERLPLGARVDGSGVLRDLREVSELSLGDHATLAITVSDNTATNRLIERVGVDRVNQMLASWDCAVSRLRRAMYDREAMARGQENEMTPAETAALLARVERRNGVPEAAARGLLARMERCQDATMLERELPPGTRVAHKTGSIDRVRNDAGIVYGPAPVIVAGFVRDLTVPAQGAAWLALLGWCALRASGRDDLPPLPPSVRHDVAR